MLLVKLLNQLLRIPEILRRFPASRYITVTRPFYEIMELPVALFNVEYPFNFPFLRVVDHRPLRFR
jgi:hypothetical protein